MPITTLQPAHRLKKGDFVFRGTGTSRRAKLITEVRHVDQGSHMHITFKDGGEIRCKPDHRLEVELR